MVIPSLYTQKLFISTFAVTENILSSVIHRQLQLEGNEGKCKILEHNNVFNELTKRFQCEELF